MKKKKHANVNELSINLANESLYVYIYINASIMHKVTPLQSLIFL